MGSVFEFLRNQDADDRVLMYMWLFTAVGFAGACYFVVNYFFKVLDKETDRLMKLDQQRINRPRNGKFTREEVAKHGSRDDLWVIIHDKVYDITDYVDEHPGGDAILSNAGGDSTEKFFGCAPAGLRVPHSMPRMASLPPAPSPQSGLTWGLGPGAPCLQASTPSARV